MDIDSKLAEYVRLLRDWYGLVGRGEDAQALVEDSLALLPHLGSARTLIDVGSGGGMPGIPLRLAAPDLQVTLLEADRRKAAFLTHAAARLAIDVEVVAERAETAAHGRLREAFDVATCRALAALPVAIELCLGFVRVGGRLLAMATEPDLEAAAHAVAELGGAPARALEAPSRLRRRGVVVVVDKERPTPAAYPRRTGVPARRPLGI